MLSDPCAFYLTIVGAGELRCQWLGFRLSVDITTHSRLPQAALYFDLPQGVMVHGIRGVVAQSRAGYYQRSAFPPRLLSVRTCL